MTDSDGKSSDKQSKGEEATTGSALMVVSPRAKNRIPDWLRQRAAVIALAAAVGAFGGAAFSFGIGYGVGSASASRDTVDPTEALRASVRQLAGEITALKAVVAGSGASKPRVISPEITGSIAPAASSADDWTLYRVENGRALVQGGDGYFEVAPGSTLPGLGLVQRITRDSGEWIVETRNGVIRSRS